MFGPAQPIALADNLKSVSSVPGTVLGIGCAYGATTVFLNKFMNSIPDLVGRPYYSTDTFSGFVPEHADHEIKNRASPRKSAPSSGTASPGTTAL